MHWFKWFRYRVKRFKENEKCKKVTQKLFSLILPEPVACLWTSELAGFSFLQEKDDSPPSKTSYCYEGKASWPGAFGIINLVLTLFQIKSRHGYTAPPFWHFQDSKSAWSWSPSHNNHLLQNWKANVLRWASRRNLSLRRSAQWPSWELCSLARCNI